jgi:predicted nucleic acid-binding protein
LAGRATDEIAGKALGDLSVSKLEELPIGWNRTPRDLVHGGAWRAVAAIAGWLISVIALGLGAPFWFDALNRCGQPSPDRSASHCGDGGVEEASALRASVGAGSLALAGRGRGSLRCPRYMAASGGAHRYRRKPTPLCLGEYRSATASAPDLPPDVVHPARRRNAHRARPPPPETIERALRTGGISAAADRRNASDARRSQSLRPTSNSAVSRTEVRSRHPIFIQGFRDAAANEALQEFHRSFRTVRVLSAIVAQELRAGGQDGARSESARTIRAQRVRSRQSGRRAVLRAWHQSGYVVSAMARKGGLELPRVSKAFGNDILLALSCRESGCVLVTDNARDFARIRRFTQFEFVGSWPTPLA